MHPHRRATIAQIQRDCQRVHGFVPKPSEIAEAKGRRGHPPQPAWHQRPRGHGEIRPERMADVISTIARLGW